MIREIEATDPSMRADVCIVGSGAAGLTLAQALDGSGLRVVVLESGRWTIDERTQRLYRSDVVGLAHKGIHELRFRVLGGTTKRWAGQALPLSELDLAEREWVASSGWPVSVAELRRGYARASELLGIRPFPADAADAWPSALPAPPAFDPRLVVPTFSQFSPRPDFAAAHEEQLGASRNVDIVLGANVTELISDPAATEVHAARAYSLGGRRLDVEADIFVVCCGGIETARLLLASDRYSDGGLGNGHDLVGRFFQDHPGFLVGPVVAARSGPLRETFSPQRDGPIKLLPLFAAAESLQRQERLLHASGTVMFHLTQSPAIDAGKLVFRAMRRPELRAPARKALRVAARDPMPLARAAGRHFLLGRPVEDTSATPMLGIGCEQAPNPDSRVYLSDQADELGMRRAVLDWRLTEQEIRSCRRFQEVVATEFERLRLGRVDADRFRLPDDPAELSGLVIDAGHHMGTTRMADDPSRGVVDADCRVFGIGNLHVASSSVFPTSGFSNPTFTLLALCLRLADALRRHAPVAV
jgi:choline dehydrogenase-like flavoprotein